ncbi:hypothetical protein OSSY52_02380 [Tepiditoga spiralis]|uniref:Uncharacterized protein n=1 Tax=Tepiditoga spiralis TaxID=2108365 RepID=A0A7G1G5D0_9BACT|nr:hypothetical protein [Tepiditoga spiralis]BBE30097.1 hypothetical protein OSSY52_02380 [Tepiditoga spiralis]
MSQVFGENTGKGFEKEEPLTIFLKAIESAVFKSAVRKNNRVYLSDIWFITSLPKDLIVEVITKYADTIKIPEDIQFIYDDKRKTNIWVRPEKTEEEKNEELNEELKDDEFKNEENQIIEE